MILAHLKVAKSISKKICFLQISCLRLQQKKKKEKLAMVPCSCELLNNYYCNNIFILV